MPPLLRKDEENRFTIEQLMIDNPGNGNQVVVTVPAGKNYIPLNFYAVFLADASVLSRIFRLNIRSGGVTIIRSRFSTAVAANSVSAVSANINSTHVLSIGGGVELVMPLTRLLEGETFETEIPSMPAGDAWTQVRLRVIVIDITDPI